MNQIKQHTACLVDLLRNYGVDPAQYLAGVVHRLDAEQAERRQKERKRHGDSNGDKDTPPWETSLPLFL